MNVTLVNCYNRQVSASSGIVNPYNQRIRTTSVRLRVSMRYDAQIDVPSRCNVKKLSSSPPFPDISMCPPKVVRSPADPKELLRCQESCCHYARLHHHVEYKYNSVLLWKRLHFVSTLLCLKPSSSAPNKLVCHVHAHIELFCRQPTSMTTLVTENRRHR